jgi:TonB family protein
MKSLRLPLAVLFAFSAYAHACFAADAAAAFVDNAQPPVHTAVDGFVFCSDPAKDQPVPVFVRLCNKRQVGTLNCGEKVEVLARHDDMLRISSDERVPHFAPASAISQKPDKFVPFDDQSGVPDRGAPDCSRFQAMEPVADGFVFCPNGKESVPAYFNPCQTHPFSGLSCGEKLGVISRNGDVLRVRLANGFLRFVPASSISVNPDQMIPFGDDSGIPDRGAPDCARVPNRDVTPPRATYTPEPEYSDKARKKKIQGVVVLSLTVGADGLPHDISVEKGIGYGLDEKAVETVSHWKFDPARKDGQPIDKHITVEVQFRLY